MESRVYDVTSTVKLVALVAAVVLVAASEAKTVVVGGSQKWHRGVNYTEWVINNGPYFMNDELVFQYNNAYNVHLLPDLWSYLTCDFSRATLLAGPDEGSGNGFSYEIDQWRPLYFASGGGRNCHSGMKFFVVAWPRWFF